MPGVIETQSFTRTKFSTKTALLDSETQNKNRNDLVYFQKKICI